MFTMTLIEVIEIFIAYIALGAVETIFLALVFKGLGWNFPKWFPFSKQLNKLIKADPDRLERILSFVK